MTNTSETSGYLAPTIEPLTEEELQDVLTAMVAGITGLAGQMVRPRWQPKPPKQPENHIPWCAVGIPDEDHDRFSAVVHEGDGDDGQGVDTVITWETLDVLASFYGPGARDLAARLRDGLCIEQNRAPLRAAGLALAEVGRMVKVPEVVNSQWLARVDLTLTLRNEARRTFGVRNITCGGAVIETDTGLIAQTTPNN